MAKKPIDVVRGEVWNVDLGWGEGSEQRGIKPCVIVQNDVGNSRSSTTIIVPITSKKKSYNKTHVEIKGNLLMTSYALCEQIRVVDKKRFGNKLAILDYETMREIENAIKIQLGM